MTRYREWLQVARICLSRRLAILSVATLAFACTAEIEPDAISAKVVSFGRFEIQNGLPVLRERVDRIECELGTIFGVDYRVEVSGGEFGVLPIEFRWVHPELSIPSRKLWGTETPARASRPEIGWREEAFEGRALWSLEHQDERVSGRYEFQIRTIPSGRIVLAQAFFLEGC